MSKPIRKAVFPVAGLGTRMLPATKALPKEMLPVVDKPVIQYAIEEAKAAGIEEFIFVTSRGKSLIEDHFDYGFELFETLKAKGKTKELDELLSWLPPAGTVNFTRQQQPLGLGHAVWCARHMVGDEPFAVVLVDDLMTGTPGCLAEMVEAHARTGGNIVAIEEVPRDQVNKYGVLDPGQDDGTLVEVKGLVEKPDVDVAPSNLTVVGRYILSGAIFALLETQERGAGGEIQLTDSMAKLIDKEPFHGLRFTGRRFDCGKKLGYLEATIACGMERPDLAEGLQDIVRRYV